MKRIIVLGLSALIFVIASASIGLFNTKQEGMTVEKFTQRVSRTDKMVFVYFNADWCVPCIKLKPGIAELEKEVDSYCETLSLDVDENPLVATHFEINTLPMFMLYKSGKCVWKNVGFLTKAELYGKISAYK